MYGRRGDAARGGFTLIEVVGALVIFSLGIIIAASFSRGLTTQMTRATLQGEVAALGRQTLDSLALVPYDELVDGADEPTLSGRTFEREWTVIQEGLRARRVEVEIQPPAEGGPSYFGTTYVVASW